MAPKTLVHLLKDPDIANEDQNESSSLVLKRKDEELVVAPGKRYVEGWGLYLEEGWEAHDIVALVLVFFIASRICRMLGSVLEGVAQHIRSGSCMLAPVLPSQIP